MQTSLRSVAPQQVLQDAVDRMVGTSEGEAAGAGPSVPAFLPSLAFAGAKPGYLFSRGPQGVG